VLYRFKVAVSSFKGFVLEPVIAQNVDSSHQVFCPCGKSSRNTLLLLHYLEKGSAPLPHFLDVLACGVSLVEAAAVLLEGVQKGGVL